MLWSDGGEYDKGQPGEEEGWGKDGGKKEEVRWGGGWHESERERERGRMVQGEGGWGMQAMGVGCQSGG